MPYKDPIDRYWIKKKTRLKSAPRYDRTGHRIEFLLTRDDVRLLLSEAGITIDEVSNKGDGYVLCRTDDLGDYAYGNCEFRRKSANLTEYWSREIGGYGYQLSLFD